MDGYTLHEHPMTSMNEEARNDALIEKVQKDPESYTLIEMTIASGVGHAIVITLATGGFWLLDTAEARHPDKYLLPQAQRIRRDMERSRDLQWLFEAVDNMQSRGVPSRRMSHRLMSVSSRSAGRPKSTVVSLSN